MTGAASRWIFSLLVLLALGSCANIVPPAGGPKDETPPRLRAVNPPDSQLSTRVSKIELSFDEYLTLSDAATQVQIAPLLSLPLTVTATNKRVTVIIPDSLLQDETTYRITFGTAIRDLHEGNVYEGKGYTFSTGAHFDSLSIAGRVINAHTGLHDSAAFVMLYSASESDSAVVRHKPMYVTRVDGLGYFTLQGLPARPFRLYALRDANSNLTFDGGSEWIAFHDSIVIPSAAKTEYELRTFPEAIDTAAAATDSAGRRQRDRFGALSQQRSVPAIPAGSYQVSADTTDIKRRTQELNIPLAITFGRKLADDINPARVFLSYDSAGAFVEAPLSISADTSGLRYELSTPWREDAVYTLRLQKGFAKDSNGSDMLPGRYTFRTKRDEDYGKLRIHLPSRMYGRKYILQVFSERDTVHQQPVTDTMVNLLRLQPGSYSMRVIVDSNENGLWDAGNLFLQLQPELVIPYNNTINLKAGWEQQVDFELPRKRSLDEQADARRR